MYVTVGALHLQQAGEDEEVRGAAAVLVRLLVAARGDVILVRPAEPGPITAEHRPSRDQLSTNSSPPEAEAAAGGAGALPALAEHLGLGGEVGVHPRPHLEVHHARLEEALGQVLHHQALAAAGPIRGEHRGHVTCLRQSQLTCPAAPWCPRTAAPPAAAPPGCSGRTWTNERRVQRPVWTNHSSPRLPLIEHLAHELVVERCQGHVPARSLHHALHVSRVAEYFFPNILMLF